MNIGAVNAARDSREWPKLAAVGVAGKLKRDARSFGDQWVSDKSSVALRLPSAVIPSEFIYLLNPAHADLSRAVKAGEEVDVFLDPRLWH